MDRSEIDARIEELERQRAEIGQRIQYLRSQRQKLVPPENQQAWVSTGDITPVVKWWTEQNSIVALSVAANVSEHTINNIINGKTVWTSEPIAEALLTAMELPHAYSQLEIVRGNLRNLPKPPESHYFEE